MTTTVVAVMHDAHVRARRAAFIAQGAAFMAAYQTVCCFIAAVALQCVARRAVRADRAATRAANHAATKAANAVKVARKEAAEQYASRVAKRAAKKAANAPMVRAAKLHAASVAKAVKAANAVRLHAVRATRAAAKAAAVIKAATIRATTATTRATTATTATARSTTADVRATRAAIVAFLAMTPCLCALWFVATLDAADKAAKKEANKALNRANARVKAPRVRINDEAKRASITLACANARASKAAKHAADAHAIALVGSVMSQRTIDARAAMGAEQREWNAARKAHKANKAAHKEIKALERIVPVVQVRAPRKALVAKLDGAHTTDKANRRLVVDKKAFYPEAAGFRTSPLHPVMAPKTEANRAKREAAEKAAKAVAARKAAKRLSRVEWELQKAHRLALKEQYIALRAAKVARICAKAWMQKGIWVDRFLAEACNDSDHDTREAAYTELLALVGVAA